MAQFHVRDIPEDVAEKVDDLANASNQSRESWLRELIVNATKQPVVKKRYSIKVYGAEGKGIIKRYGDGDNNVGGGCSNFSQEEFDAYNKAQDYVSRNQPGDREVAIKILREVFEEVFEQ
jgi:hypothetical protein